MCVHATLPGMPAELCTPCSLKWMLLAWGWGTQPWLGKSVGEWRKPPTVLLPPEFLAAFRGDQDRGFHFPHYPLLPSPPLTTGREHSPGWREEKAPCSIPQVVLAGGGEGMGASTSSLSCGQLWGWRARERFSPGSPPPGDWQQAVVACAQQQIRCDLLTGWAWVFSSVWQSRRHVEAPPACQYRHHCALSHPTTSGRMRILLLPDLFFAG